MLGAETIAQWYDGRGLYQRASCLRKPPSSNPGMDITASSPCSGEVSEPSFAVTQLDPVMFSFFAPSPDQHHLSLTRSPT